MNKLISKEQINGKHFFSFFLFPQFFSKLKVTGTNKHITLRNLKKGMKRLGLKISEATQKNLKENSPILSTSLYDGYKEFKKAILEEIYLIKKMKLSGYSEKNENLDDFYSYYKSKSFQS